MAGNQTFDLALRMAVVPTNGGATSGAPGRYGVLTGVAMADQRAADSLTPMNFGYGAYTLSVKAINDSGNSAVAVGDGIFYVDGDTPKLSKKASGYFFGIALAIVTIGATATIQVMHIPTAGTVPASSVNSAAIAANAVTAAKLTTTMATGNIILPLGSWRIIATNDIDTKANVGGLMGKDTTPLLERVSTSTDKQQRIRWAATGVGEIAIGGIVTPPDFDETVAPVFKCIAAMGGATDTPALTVSCFEGVGGSTLGGATGAVTGTTVAVYSRTLTAFAAAPKVYSFGLVPGTHGTDTCLLYAAWLEYTRK